ncbi:restriction endonuclease subunit S [Mammaliicoccus sciuri]|uniref:restriction endonuclease subunit S n=1 Tax=Mammaliicoccus sciuri TaxID=1296 RepID=UPI003CF02BEC
MKFNTFQNRKPLKSAKQLGWNLVILTDLLKDDSRNVTKIKKGDYLEDGKIPIIDQGKQLIGGYSNLNEGFYNGDSYIVFGDHTRIIKYIDFPSFIGADGVKVLKNKNKNIIDTKYLYYFLQSINIPDAGYSRHFKFLKEIIVPVPPLKVQLQIVNKISKMYSITKKREQQIEALSVLKQSVFLEMFGDPTSNPKRYVKKQLKEIGEIITGNTPPRKDKDNYGDYVEWIKTNNINENSIYLSQAIEYLSEKGASIGRVVSENSILVTCIAGSKSSIGRAAIANRRVSFNQQINAICPSEVINTSFLYTQIKILKPYIQSFSTNSMKIMISKTNFEKIEVIVPTLEAQTEFHHKFEQINSIEKKMKNSLICLEEMYDSLLHKSFNGELFKEEIKA